MADIKQYGLYLGSWEYMYLGTGLPRGLPNQLFSKNAYLLILFENIYCDENGLIGEQNAYNQLGWTNSKLFIDFASSKCRIIQPLPINSIVENRVSNLRIEKGISNEYDFQKTITQAHFDELLQFKYEVLFPFINENRLIAYEIDFDFVENAKPIRSVSSVHDILNVKCPHVYLSKRINELSSKNLQIFHDLQNYERNILLKLRKGDLEQETVYLPYLKNRIDDYRKIDIELSAGISKRFEDILRYRERFSSRNGWKYVREYFEAYNSIVPVDIEELVKLQNQIQVCLEK